ncbi:hypothetical protein FO519_006429 [Halicephalobus sp. NKZ332]|nr:hypothetical protein FO519_006429 [Halicephalobus sp. NKZ332]
MLNIFCGGAAIAPHFMITAAHCVEKLIAPDNISFHVGIGSLIKEDGILLHISKIIIHKNYLNNTDVKGGRMLHDIALIYVKDKISDENIIGLANRAERVGESGKLTGFDEYKDLRDYSRFPVKLQEAYFTILPIRAEGAPTMFFTSGRGGQGDGGAPFVWEESGKPVLGGIYTGMAGLEDNTVRPQFIRIIDFKHWITYQMKKTL